LPAVPLQQSLPATATIFACLNSDHLPQKNGFLVADESRFRFDQAGRILFNGRVV
jgi:hypothetical protein